MVDSAKKKNWEERIRKCVSSGMSVKMWCLQNDVTRAAYYYWANKLKEESSGPNSDQWAEVVMQKPQRPEQVNEIVESETDLLLNYHDYTITIGKSFNNVVRLAECH